MADFTINRTKSEGAADTTVVSIAGEMNIQHATEIKAALLEAFAEAGHLQLDMDKVTEIDLAGLQLLCSAHRASILANKSFTAAGVGGEMIEAAAVAAGFPRHVGCVQDVNKTCIWAGGGN